MYFFCYRVVNLWNTSKAGAANFNYLIPFRDFKILLIFQNTSVDLYESNDS